MAEKLQQECKKDILNKVRPLYNSIRKKCISMEKKSNITIDEQMVPFKGKLALH